MTDDTRNKLELAIDMLESFVQLVHQTEKLEFRIYLLTRVEAEKPVPVVMLVIRDEDRIVKNIVPIAEILPPSLERILSFYIEQDGDAPYASTQLIAQEPNEWQETSDPSPESFFVSSSESLH